MDSFCWQNRPCCPPFTQFLLLCCCVWLEFFLNDWSWYGMTGLRCLEEDWWCDWEVKQDTPWTIKWVRLCTLHSRFSPAMLDLFHYSNSISTRFLSCDVIITMLPQFWTYLPLRKLALNNITLISIHVLVAVNSTLLFLMILGLRRCVSPPLPCLSVSHNACLHVV